MSKITRLQAENLKKLRVIDIRPGGGVVPIRGRNAQGKSSTLDAIQAALGGKRAMPSRPVRAGEDEGAVRLELDSGMVILRRFTSDGGDTLEVTNAEGFKAGSPQKMLDGLYSSVAFDPIAYSRLEPKDQLARLRGLVKLDVDVDALEAANKGDFEARAGKNRELKSERARLDQMPEHPDAPAEKVDEAVLEAVIAGAVDTNAAIERRRASREQAAIRVDEHIATAGRWRTEAARLRAEAVEADGKVEEAENAAKELSDRLAAAEPLPDAVDVSQAQADLRSARIVNEHVAANARRAAQIKLVDALGREADELTQAMDQRRDQIAAAFERADLPVPGLGFGDGEVLFNGVPLEQASSAEQLRVSTAIGMAQAPKLRVMLVRDGSLLDDEGERILAELAETHDFQLWVEAVDTSGKVGIVLQDGAVVAVDGEPAPEPEEIGKPRRRVKKGSEPAAEEIGQEPQKSALEGGDPAREEIGSVVNVEASLDSGRAETFSAEQDHDSRADAAMDADDAAGPAPWEDEADHRHDERRADADAADAISDLFD